MKQVTIHEAKTHLSRLIDEALSGEEIIIARRKHPLVRLTVLPKARRGRRIGALPNLILRMSDEFNAPMEDWESKIDPDHYGTKKEH